MTTLLFNKENTPNASILTQSLRHLGYDNYSAICDIIDNSVDAEATIIKVSVHQEKGQPVIRIIDNGHGMTEDILDEALRLGSNVERNLSSDLGKFGMGLCTASLSLCKRVEVYTKTRDRALLKSISDVDEIIQQQKFVKFIGPANEQDYEMFDSLLSNEESGTIVVLRKCDNLRNSNLTQFKNTVKKEISRVFRMFILANKQFYVNEELCIADDPLAEAEIYSDEYYPIVLKDSEGNEVSEQIRVKLAILPDYGADGNKERGFNIRTQGFYVMRNSREVISAENLGLFNKHNDYNRFRGEIWFNAALDDFMGVNFTKKRIDPHQAIFDKLNQVIAPQLKAIRNKLRKANVAQQNSEISHQESAKLITQKSHLLIKPKGQKEIRSSKDPNQTTKTESSELKKQEKTRNNFSKSRLTNLNLNCRFETSHMGQGGLVYDTYLEGKTIVIQWNVDHPFYERFVIANKDDKTMLTSVDFLVYSLSSAELTVLDDDNQLIIDNIKSIMSSNMRTLLV